MEMITVSANTRNLASMPLVGARVRRPRRRDDVEVADSLLVEDASEERPEASVVFKFNKIQ